MGESRFQLCCIPFAAYGYALGDVVEAAEWGASAYTIARLVQASGRTVLRVWLGDSKPATWDELQRLIQSRKLLYEFRKPALVAIDVVDQSVRAAVEAELRRLTVEEHLTFEVGSQAYVEGNPGPV